MFAEVMDIGAVFLGIISFSFSFWHSSALGMETKT